MRKEIKIATGIGFVGLVALAVIGWLSRSDSSPATDETGSMEIARHLVDEDRIDPWSDDPYEPAESDYVASPQPVMPEREPRRGDRPLTELTREDYSRREVLPAPDELVVEEEIPAPVIDDAPAEEVALADQETADELPAEPPTVVPEPPADLRAPAVDLPADPGDRVAPPAGLAVTTRPAPMREYVIQPNDTLSAIALRFYGNARYADELIRANPGIRPRHLRVGMKLNIPELAVETAPVAPTGVAVDPLPEIPPQRAYRVQPGEGWYELAQRFLGNGNEWPELFEENRGRVPRNPQHLRAGTLIQLPERAIQDQPD